MENVLNTTSTEWYQITFDSVESVFQWAFDKHHSRENAEYKSHQKLKLFHFSFHGIYMKSIRDLYIDTHIQWHPKFVE